MDLLKLFHNDTDTKRFNPGEVIFEQGSYGEEMYVIVEGQVDITVNDRWIYTAELGEICGIMALIDDKARSATAIAKNTCSVVPVNQKRFQFLVQQKALWGSRRGLLNMIPFE